MITGKTKLLDAMIEAYQMEKGLHEFYQLASTKAKADDIQQAFGKLAGWENEHMRYLQFLYQAIRDEREMLAFEDFKKRSPAVEIEGGIPLKEAEQFLEKRDFKTDRDALGLALDVENKARDLYKSLSSSVEDANTRVFLEDMMRQEERHIRFVNNLLSKST